jgi:hypothetical protein
MIDSTRRKELKSSYQQTRQQAGVYRITNSATGRVLLISTTNLASAKNRLDFAISQKMAGALDQRLKKEVLAHGFEALSFEVLETIDPAVETTEAELAEDLKTLEALWKEQLTGSDFY